MAKSETLKYDELKINEPKSTDKDPKIETRPIQTIKINYFDDVFGPMKMQKSQLQKSIASTFFMILPFIPTRGAMAASSLPLENLNNFSYLLPWAISFVSFWAFVLLIPFGLHKFITFPVKMALLEMF